MRATPVFGAISSAGAAVAALIRIVLFKLDPQKDFLIFAFLRHEFNKLHLNFSVG